MNQAFLAIVGGFAAALVAAPAFSDEAPATAKPVRHARPIERAPRQAAPASERGPGQAAPASNQPNWSGAQIGGQGGVSGMAQGFAEPGASQCFRNHDLEGSPIAPICAETPFNFNSRFQASASGGGFVGYNVQLGTMVIGFEADVSGKNGSSSANKPVPPVVKRGFSVCEGCFSTRTENFYGNVEQGWDTSFRMRFGYLVTPMTMIYFTGGLAAERVSGSFTYTANTLNNIDGALYQDTTTGSRSWSQVRTGWTVGGGVEVGVGGGWKARVEYRYSGFGNLSEDVPLRRSCAVVTDFPGCPSPNVGSTNAHIDLTGVSFQSVKLGLAYSL